MDAKSSWIAAVLELLGAVVSRLRERLDHVAALGEETEIRVGLAVVGIAVLAEEQLRVAGAREDVVGFGQRSRRQRPRVRFGIGG